jgi:hypothetical protein
MNPVSLSALDRAEVERRASLAALPFNEKVRIVEKLPTMGRTLRTARGQLRRDVSASLAERNIITR